MPAPAIVTPGPLAAGVGGSLFDVFPLATVTIGTPTTLLAPSDLRYFSRLELVFCNLDLAVTATVLVEPMDDSGTYPDTQDHGGPSDPLIILPGQMARFSVADDFLHRVWTVQASTPGPAFTPIQLQWSGRAIVARR